MTSQTSDFTCVGVGDMSGDVFGNGMLLSKHTRLVGAFNHQHIFIDPDPDPARTWTERKRLFDLPRSGWADYDSALLSPGGGDLRRAAPNRSPLSPQAQALLGIDRATHDARRADPARCCGRAVDLMWFGGIGTYVKASDARRTPRPGTAPTTRCASTARSCGRKRRRAKAPTSRVTQRGRIEYALRGGRINTDAIDNSAGVDTSDHEVNIKIGVGQLIAAGRSPPSDAAGFSGRDDGRGRRRWCCGDNELQTLAISLAEAEAPALLDRMRA